MGQFKNKLCREIVRPLSDLCLKSTTVRYLGETIKIPLVHGIGADYHLIKEDWMALCLKNALKTKPGAVIDIGTNIGLYLVKLRALDTERNYYGFEPNPLCNYFIQEMIRLNRFKNTKLFPVALSDRTQLMRFHAGRKADKMGSLNSFARHDGYRSMDFSFDLITQPGDPIIALLNLDEVAVIKVDVEGAELKVINGIRQTIEKHRPYIYCEIWPLPEPDDPFFAEIAQNRTALLTLMKEMGYCILGMGPGGSPVNVNKPEDFNGVLSNDFLFSHYLDINSIKSSINHSVNNPEGIGK